MEVWLNLMWIVKVGNVLFILLVGDEDVWFVYSGEFVFCFIIYVV